MLAAPEAVTELRALPQSEVQVLIAICGIHPARRMQQLPDSAPEPIRLRLPIYMDVQHQHRLLSPSHYWYYQHQQQLLKMLAAPEVAMEVQVRVQVAVQVHITTYGIHPVKRVQQLSDSVPEPIR